MKEFFYICPRCGRRWSFYIPHKKVTCKFCNERWDTTKRPKGSYSRFSWRATFLWLFGFCAIAYGAARVACLDEGIKAKLPPFLGGTHEFALGGDSEKRPDVESQSKEKPWLVPRTREERRAEEEAEERAEEEQATEEQIDALNVEPLEQDAESTAQSSEDVSTPELALPE